MNKLTNLLRRIPKRFVGLAIAAVAVITPAIVMAYGPERPTFTMQHPAPYVTFNSITDNPNYGDEREFLTVQDLTTGEGLGPDTKLVPDHEYSFQLYIHNNASETLNASGVGIAKDVTVRARLPQSVTGSDTADAFVNASNMKPTEGVFDTVKLMSDNKVDLEFVNGSAMLHTRFQQTQLSDNFITTGVKVGHKDLTGTWNGCLEFAGAVSFKVKVKGQPKFEMKKEVSKHDAKQWSENYTAKPGEVVDYRISYDNTGTTKQENVVVKDTLPAGMTYVAGSTRLVNASNSTGKTLTDDITKGGINIGHYTANSNAFVYFSAKIADNDLLPKCGDNLLHNIAKVETDNGSKEDDANVTVPKTCQPPQAEYKCTGLTVTPISRTQFKFEANKEVKNAEFVKFIYVIREVKNGQETEIARTENNTYNQDKVGNYTVEAILVVKLDSQEKQVTDANCKKPFEVKEQPPQNKYVCESIVKIEKTRDTFDFTVKAPVEGNVKVKEYKFVFGDSQDQTVGAETQTVTHTYKEARDYVAQVFVTFEVDGKTVTDVTSDNCKVPVTVKPVPPVECKPGVPMNDEKCKEVPTTPQQPKVPGELPSTGPEAVVGGLFGSSALGLGVHSWLNSRRAIKNAVNKK